MKWGCYISHPFYVPAEVRRDCVLLSALFALHMNSVITKQRLSGIGTKIGNFTLAVYYVQMIKVLKKYRYL